MPENTSPNLPQQFSSSEVELLAMLLEEAGNEFADHSANDFTMPATDENKAIFAAAFELCAEPQDEDDENSDEDGLSLKYIMEAEDQVFVYNDWLMTYLASRCQNLFKQADSAPALTKAELNIMSELLAEAHEDRLNSAGSVCYDLTFLATPKNKVLMAAVVNFYEDDNYEEEGKKETIIDIINTSQNEKDEIDVPDYWIMHYFAHVCEMRSK
ncbi:hypothetical protein ACO0K9_03750 [Undibacterium sp. Ji50W]|uniref:hypothetical protein n=1 Tax=Undibacterium sp. Ji50W TaxID=3413041 RepID=UPI003BF346C7